MGPLCSDGSHFLPPTQGAAKLFSGYPEVQKASRSFRCGTSQACQNNPVETDMAQPAVRRTDLIQGLTTPATSFICPPAFRLITAVLDSPCRELLVKGLVKAATFFLKKSRFSGINSTSAAASGINAGENITNFLFVCVCLFHIVTYHSFIWGGWEAKGALRKCMSICPRVVQKNDRF